VLGSRFLWSWFTNNLRQPHTACNNSWWVRTYCGASQKRASCGVCENHVFLAQRCLLDLTTQNQQHRTKSFHTALSQLTRNPIYQARRREPEGEVAPPKPRIPGR
jgi:hypothetical protein